MKKEFWKVIIRLAILVAIVIALYIISMWFSRITGYYSGQQKAEELAKCLSSQGVIVYGAELSPGWDKQKNVFGRVISKLNYVMCNETGDICAGLREIPAWYINGSVYYGVKNLTELGSISGCSN